VRWALVKGDHDMGATQRLVVIAAEQRWGRPPSVEIASPFSFDTFRFSVLSFNIELRPGAAPTLSPTGAATDHAAARALPDTAPRTRSNWAFRHRSVRYEGCGV